MKRVLALCLVLFAAPTFAVAQVELSVYGGIQGAPASDIAIRGDDVIGRLEPRCSFSIMSSRSLPTPAFQAVD